jgi:hypothetical protein
MGRMADPELASLWRMRVEGQVRSGLSVAEYCRREGFSAGSFYAWKRRLRTSRATSGKHTGRRGPQRGSVDRASRGGFVQVPLAVESVVDVRFVDGTLVSVPVAYLAATLQALQASQSEGATDG